MPWQLGAYLLGGQVAAHQSAHQRGDGIAREQQWIAYGACQRYGGVGAKQRYFYGNFGNRKQQPERHRHRDAERPEPTVHYQLGCRRSVEQLKLLAGYS